METVYEAQNRLENTMDGKNGFSRGVSWSNKWIDVDEKLPTKDELVLVKLTRCSWTLNKYATAYLDSSYIDRNVWIVENRHCTHHKEAVNNAITHWRPIDHIDF